MEPFLIQTTIGKIQIITTHVQLRGSMTSPLVEGPYTNTWRGGKQHSMSGAVPQPLKSSHSAIPLCVYPHIFG